MMADIEPRLQRAPLTLEQIYGAGRIPHRHGVEVVAGSMSVHTRCPYPGCMLDHLYDAARRQ